jgi:glycosyltransferase involved in cell wall biosynthesis
MDYLDLLRILLTRYRLRRLDAIHFVTPSSLFFRPAVRAKRYIVSSVDSTGKSRGYLFRSALNKGFHVDNLSRAIADEILNEGISDADHLHVTPCSFTNIEAARVGDKKPVVVFSGRFVPGKGLELLLKALPQLFNKCPQVKVEILGQGPLEKEINQYLKGRSWSNNVRVAFEDEPFDVLKHSIIFLSLQDLENYPSQSLLEAMVCGNAVVATDVGMTRDIVDEKVGILIQPQAESLVQAIEKMLSDFDQTVRMGQNARQRVLEKHTVEKFARYLENIYVEDDHG